MRACAWPRGVWTPQERILLMMQMSGLKMPVYWAVAFVYDFLLYAVIVVAVFGVSLAFEFRFVAQTRSVRARCVAPTLRVPAS